MARLSAERVAELDPYAFLAVLGKRVIHPGGRASTDRLLAWADLGPGDRVLDIGCGVATTAIRIARETGASVVAADISPLMRERATRNVEKARAENVVVEQADILDLPYADGSFDCVLAEAVTMFVDRPRAAAELARVCASPAGGCSRQSSAGASHPVRRPGRSSWDRCVLACSSTRCRSGCTSTPAPA
jgi:ubiquinone/menaquinone biosynthesis C-methylase UbiE